MWHELKHFERTYCTCACFVGNICAFPKTGTVGGPGGRSPLLEPILSTRTTNHTTATVTAPRRIFMDIAMKLSVSASDSRRRRIGGIKEERYCSDMLRRTPAVYELFGGANNAGTAAAWPRQSHGTVHRQGGRNRPQDMRRWPWRRQSGPPTPM